MTDVNPRARYLPKGSLILNDIFNPRKITVTKSAIMVTTPIKPVSSAIFENMKSVKDSGR